MKAEPGRSIVTRVVARRALRSGVVWGLVFGAIAVSSIIQFTTAYSTPEGRRAIARSAGGNGAIRVLFGAGQLLETIPGWVAWRSLGIVAIVGSVWGLLGGTRWLRGEEDSGRWELLVAGPTTRRDATRSALVGLGAGLLVLWATTASVTCAADWSTAEADLGLRASLFLALALVAPAGVALAVGAFASQLVPTRRQASALGAVALAAAFVVRMVGSSTAGLRWLLWATPFGWVQHLRPLTGSSPWPLVPLSLLVISLAVGAVWLAGQRDVGAGVRPSDDRAPSRYALLTGPLGLTVRLERPVLLSWGGGVCALGFLFGVIAATVADTESAGLSTALARLGARQEGIAAYIGTFFFIVSAVLAFVAAGQIAAARREEAEARLDTLMAEPVRRLTWLGCRVVVAGAALVALATLAGVAGWAGAASQDAGVGVGELVTAALNAAIPSLAALGLGVLALAVVPRRAVAVVYGLVAWSFIVKLLVIAGPGGRVLLDLSLFHHVALMPAAPFRAVAAAVLLGLAGAAAVLGAAAFRRRDLIGS